MRLKTSAEPVSEYWNERRRAENPAVGAIGGGESPSVVRHPLWVCGQTCNPSNQRLGFVGGHAGGTHRRKAAQQLYLHLKGIGIPFDLLVVTLNLLEKHKNNIGLIYKTVLEEGRELSAI